MLPLLIALVVIILVAWACFWLIDSSGIPHPINMIAKVIVALIAVVALLTKSGLLSGTGLL
jgi:glucan phosphoethanolaminetransferase (alkaline phosphatase superfamily)